MNETEDLFLVTPQISERGRVVGRMRTVEVESLVSDSTFSTSLGELILIAFFLLFLGNSFPFLAFLFGEDAFPASHLGHRTCTKHTSVIAQETAACPLGAPTECFHWCRFYLE